MQDPGEILKRYWGFDAFRPQQAEIIQSVLDGRDTLAVMPTGGGKSICFQVPALLKEGICLVVTPLISLMKDQVGNLKKKGIPALCLYSGMSFIEVKKTLQNAMYGNFKFLYVSPERLESELFLQYLPELRVHLVAIDEAHCISQWGYDFRPSYLHIASLREYLPGIPVMALTASATVAVQKDIAGKLLFREGSRFYHQPYERPRLSYSAFEVSSKKAKLLDIIEKVPGGGIVYCKSRKRTREISDWLRGKGVEADFYHGGLSADLRNKKQEDWTGNKTRIIVCTNAFGMGIDKPDVRTVIHYDVPDALENYYQEAGRAGRDGEKAYAVLFYNATELDGLLRQSAVRFPSRENIRKVYAALCHFFNLPAGSGEGLSYDFDINVFVENFNLDIYVAANVLKILEQEELIRYHEQFFAPSTAVFTSDKSTWSLFEKSQPGWGKVIQGLLRTYDGIFDNPSVISEKQLAASIRIPQNRLVNLLLELKSHGIIEYIPQREKPQVYFLRDRVRTDDLMINEKNVLKRKEAFEKRLEAMTRFAKAKDQCRSKMIAAYFGDSSMAPCGICDNCLAARRGDLKRKNTE